MADTPGLLLVAHRYDRESTAHLRTLLGAAADGPARLAGVGHAAFDDIVTGARALRERGCDGIVVVPLLIVSASTLARGAAAVAGVAAATLDTAVALTPALDAAPEVTEVLTDRARDLAGGAAGDHAVLLVGHGPSRREDLPPWDAAGMELARAVREAGGFASARAGVVQDDAEPPVRETAVRGLRDRAARYAADTGREVLLVPWLVGAGHLTRTHLPADFADLPIRYDGRPLLPHPMLARWVRRRFVAGCEALASATPGDVVAVLDEREGVSGGAGAS